MHNLTHLLQASPSVQRAIALDRTDTYKKAWHTITNLWQKDELRYWDKQGDEDDSENFMNAINLLHAFILHEQGEAS